jgi:GntR family transcriptional regulator, arabinose operon transcriptional repressor
MTPKYQTIIDSIINKIRLEGYKEGEKLPSESQLVAEFDTSRITVTRALKELELTGVIYREKGRGSFVAQKSVKSNNVISLIIPHKADFFSGGQQYIRSVYKYCQKMGYLCSVHYSQQSSKKERAILEDIISHQVAGIILYPIDNKNIDIISRILIKNCPIVLLDRKLDEVDLPAVESDNYQGALDAVNYLLENGHRRIAFVGVKDAHSVTERYKGYCRALINKKIPINQDIIFTHYKNNNSDDIQETLDSEGAETILDELLSIEPVVSAVFCVNDLIAFQLMKAAQKRNILVPGDLSFVGFDNISFPTESEITLSSVEQEFDQIGKACVKLLWDQIESGIEGSHSIIIPTTLKIGQTVARI